MTLRLTPDAELAELLETMFDRSELLRIIRKYEGLAILAARLSGDARAHEVVLAALNEGCVDDLLLAVRRERPVRAAELAPLARRWGLDFPHNGLFVAHAAADAEAAGKLVEALRTRGFPAEMLSGGALPGADSGYLLVGLSAEASRAPWMTVEWLASVVAGGILPLVARFGTCDPPVFVKVLPGFDVFDPSARPLDDLCRFLVRDRRPITLLRESRVFRDGGSPAAAVSRLSPAELRALLRLAVPPDALARFIGLAGVSLGDATGDTRHALVEFLGAPENAAHLDHFAEWCVSAPPCRRSVRELLRRWGAAD